MMASNLFVGVAGWSYPEWSDLLGDGGSSEINALSELFDLIEITSSYYHPPSAKNAEQWLAQTQSNPRLRFTMRLWQKLVREKSSSWKTDVETFKRGLQPLQKSRRLGALVLPFSSSYRATTSNEEWLWRLLDAFAGFPLVVEALHASWQQSELLRRLPALGVAVAMVDQPQRDEPFDLPNSGLKQLAYVRLNGRNLQKWLAPSARRDERFDYVYRPGELSHFAVAARRLGNQAESCCIVFHNHPKGQALANALQLQHALTGRKIHVPENLCRHFPALQALAAVPPASQLEMF